MNLSRNYKDQELKQHWGTCWGLLASVDLIESGAEKPKPLYEFLIEIKIETDHLYCFKEHEQAFNKPRVGLMQGTALRNLNINLPFSLQLFASQVAIIAQFLQERQVK